MNGTSASQGSVVTKGFIEIEIENIDQDADISLKLIIIQEVGCVLQDMRRHKLYKILPGSSAFNWILDVSMSITAIQIILL